MNADFLISTTLTKTSKFKDLAKRLGGPAPALFALYRLWSFTAVYRPDGDLTDIDPFEIPLTEVEWKSLWESRGTPVPTAVDQRASERPLVLRNVTGTPDRSVKSSGAEGWLEHDADGKVKVHDWERHNAWAAKAAERVENARRAGIASRLAKLALSESDRSDFNGRSNGRCPTYDIKRESISTPTPIRSASNSDGGSKTDSDPDGSEAPTLTLQKPDGGKPKRTAPSPLIDAATEKWLDSTFEWFYGLFPRHEKRHEARKAWGKLHTDLKRENGQGLTKEVRERIALDIKRRLDNRTWEPMDSERKQFITMPATYLNQRRWEDGEA